tara:strand:- start:1684 stop:2565 length:882 start_codon:yes stop_codon:yes gene_type:complete
VVTIFSTPKDFSGEFDIIQRNAMNSWRAISEEIEIIIIGESLGAKDAAKSISAKYIKNVETSNEGTPTISGLFGVAEKYANNNILCYVNADIILPKNFLGLISILLNEKRKFMTVGYRWDLDVPDPIDFRDDKILGAFWENAKKNAKKHACTGIDYFIFKKGTFKNMLDLAIGRFGWDNWLLWKVRRMRIPLIDVSNEIFAIHQNHSYRFGDFKSESSILSNSESIHNQNKIDGKTLNLLDANYHLDYGKIKKKGSKEFINRNLGKLPIIFPEFSLLLKIYKKLYRKYWLWLR